MGQQVIDINLKGQMDNSQVKKSVSEIKSDLDKALNSNALRTMDKDATKVAESMKKVASDLNNVTAKLEQAKNIQIPTQQYTELQQTIQSVEKELDKTIAKQERMATSVSRNPLVQEYTELQRKIATANKDLEMATQIYGNQARQVVTIQAEIAEYEQRLDHIRTKAEQILAPVNQLERQINDQKVDLQQLNEEASKLVQTGKAYTLGDPAQIEKYSQQQQIIADKADVLIQKDEELRAKEAEIAQAEAERVAKLIEINQNAGEINPKIADTLSRLQQVRSELDGLIERQRQLEEAGAGLGHAEYDENLAKIAQLQDEEQELLGMVSEYRDEQAGVNEEVTQTVSISQSLKSVWDGIVGVIRSGINVVNQIWKGVTNVANAVKKVAQHTREANSEASKSSGHWQKTLWTIAKALIGVRGLFALVRKIRKAIVEGFTNLTKESVEAANSLNLLSAKFMQLKNSVGAAIAPLANMIAPVISRIIDLFTRAFNAVAMFFGALTGKKTVMVAKSLDASAGAALNDKSSGGSKKKTAEEKYQEAVEKAQLKYEKELAKYNDKVAKAEAKQAKAAAKLAKEQEKANGELASFDELNNLTSDSVDDTADALEDYMAGLEEPELEMPDMDDFLDAGGGGGGIGDMFEEAVIGEGFQELADKFKAIAKDLFEPIKKAWEDVGDFVVDSWKKAWESVKALTKDVWRDFITVWKQEETVEIFRNILRIIGDIGLMVSGLADKIREAWNYNDTGLRILEHIRNLIGIIVGWFRKASDYTVEWINTLDFKPLFTSIEKFLGALEPVVDSVMGVLYDFYTEVLLPLGKWVLEKGLPQLVDILTQLLEDIDWEKLRADLAEFWKHLEPFAERVGQGLIDFIKDLAERLAKWVNSGKFEEFLEKIEKWMDNVSAEDVSNFASAISQIAGAIGAFKLLNIGGITSAIGGFITSLGKLLGIAVISRKLGGVKGIVNLLFGKGAAAEATAAATETGTAVGEAVGEAVVTGATTAIDAGAVATGAAVTGMVAVGVGAFSVLAATGNKYADDMRKILDPHEIAVYGDTLEGLGTTFKNTADTIIGKANEIKDNSIDSVNSLAEYTKSYNDASTLQRQAVENANDAFWKQQNALKQLDEALTRESDEIYRNGVVSDETRVKIDEARNAVEVTTQAYENAKGALSEANDAMEFVRGQYDLLPESAKNAVGGIDDVDIAMQKIHESAKSYADEQAQIQIANNNLKGNYSELSDTVNGFSATYSEEQAKIQMANNNLKGDYSNTSSEVISSVDTMKTEVSTKMDEMSTKLGESGTSGADAYADNFVTENTARLGDYTQSGADDIAGFQSGVESASGATFSWFGTFFNSLIDTVKSIFQCHSPSVVFNNIGINVMAGLLNGLQSMGQSIMTWISSFIQNIVDAFSTLGQSISDTVTGWKDALSDFSLSGAVSNIGSRISNKLHGYASGQVIPPNMAAHLAVLGDNNNETEVVSPLSTMKEAMVEALATANIGGNSNVPIIIQIDGREVFRAVRDQNAIYQNQTGESAF